jgi:hypothetical protein
MSRCLSAAVASIAAVLVLAGPAHAGGGDYVFDGGTARQHGQVRAALEASAFDWSVVPARITVHIAPDTGSYARPGHIWLDARVLDAGRFSWAVVQDEYAHQVDFFLFDAATRDRLNAALGARDWCYGIAGLRHHEYGCERFASTLVWSYWPSRHNAYRPTSRRDESAAMAPARFRVLMAELVASRRS